MNCEVSKGTKDAKYARYRLSEDKKWINVCTEHEQEIGDRNLEIQGVYNEKANRKTIREGKNTASPELCS